MTFPYGALRIAHVLAGSTDCGQRWDESPLRCVLSPMARHLLIADDVARLLSAAQLAHCNANIDDPDLFCSACAQRIAPSAQAALMVLTNEAFALITYAHPACRRSGVYPRPGLSNVAREHFVRQAAVGIDMTTLLALRSTEPRALLFLELPIMVPLPGADPLAPWAELLGLSPVSGSIEQLSAPPTEEFTISRRPDGLALLHPRGINSVFASRSDVATWLRAADDRAIVIIARGLGLSRAKPTVEEALQFRPAWAAVASIEDVVPTPRPHGALRGLARKLLQPAPR